MRVDFYRFSKKSNSTKRPTGSAYASYDCVLKDGCSIMNPVILLDVGLVSRPNLNYAYIADFGRWYFINDWTFTRRMWVGSLACDVLATFKPTISNMNLYILRSSAQSNEYIIDGKYPITCDARSYIDNIGAVYCEDTLMTDYFNTTLAAGYYYLGVVGANGNGVNWYCMDAFGFNRLVSDLYAFTPSDMQDVSSGVAKQLADPLQYVVSTYWLPSLPYPSFRLDETGPTIKFGDYSIRIYHAAQFDPVASIRRFSAQFTLRKHPQQSRGKWLNQSPYSRYTLLFAPFGTYELDSSLMIDDASVTCEWYIDYSTGMADLTVQATNSYMAHVNSSFAVPIRLNQMTLDMYGGASSLLSAGLGLSQPAQSVLSAIIGGLAGGLVPSSGASQPKVGSKGTTGSFLPFKALTPKLYTDFYYVADEDNTDLGRPLGALTTPATLGSGYMIAADAHFENEYALESEIDQINAFLTGGFYYE